jgi:hypothetical protein
MSIDGFNNEWCGYLLRAAAPIISEQAPRMLIVCETGQFSDKMNAGQSQSNYPALFLDCNCFSDN